MKFQKLILVSAVATAMSSGAYAMESLTDDAMSAATGQDGLTLSIATPTAGLSFQANIYDSNGFGTMVSPGVIVIGGTANKVKLVTPAATTINLLIDAGSTAVAGSATLNIAVSIPTGTVINTGDIQVASTTSAAAFANTTNVSGVLLNNMAITLGATTANVQLGYQPQGALVALNTSMTGGLSIAGFALNDAGGGSSISVTNISLKDAGGANLTVVATVAAKPAGLVITATQFGNATSGLDTQLTAVKLGGAPAIGNVAIIGLNVNGTTLTIAGH